MKTHHAMKSVFKKYHEILSDKYLSCKKHFNSLSKRFEGNNKLPQEYNNIIKEQLILNVVEKVPPSETETLCDFCGTKMKMKLLLKVFHYPKCVIIVFVVYCLGLRHHLSY